ncbi:hypothetical protein Pres01_20890 [Metapseudomonas resinovorans]|uniref:DUF924 family protein n=1 Tax=Metapseudomonas resinovorans TaxID=53412 RepID=UPI0009854B7D|nr:DUF924 family protein [Pseudomonas resinovorans]GLZ86038.1 hypothetical protein Pres01_20890 [Pseudomonas resinovorans]
MQPWQPLLDWWFGPEASASQVAAARQGLWFGKKDHQDAEARERFGGLVEQALEGGLADWVAQPDGWLALVLLLDQLPRMLFRNDPRSFAGDARAQALVADGLARGLDRHLSPIRQVFICLVLEHAEDLASQERALYRYRLLLDGADAAERALFENFLDFSERHRVVIARFGRFPHRNAVLGRVSSDEESSFLREPGSRF